jgi:hypothetical protein
MKETMFRDMNRRAGLSENQAGKRKAAFPAVIIAFNQAAINVQPMHICTIKV